MAEPHGDRLTNSVEKILNEIRTYTPQKAYKLILKQEMPVILSVFHTMDKTAEGLEKPISKSLPIRERLSQEALKRSALPLLYGIMKITEERVKLYLTSLKEGRPFVFYNLQEKDYIQKVAQRMEPNVVAAATLRTMKRSAKRNAATKRKSNNSLAIVPLSTTRKQQPRTARNIAVNWRNQALKYMVLDAEESKEIDHNVLWAKVYLQRANDLLEDAIEFANPDAYKVARQALSSAEFTLNTADVLRQRKTRTNLDIGHHEKEINHLIADKKKTETLLYTAEILLFNDNPKHFIPPIYPSNVVAQNPLGSVIKGGAEDDGFSMDAVIERFYKEYLRGYRGMSSREAQRYIDKLQEEGEYTEGLEDVIWRRYGGYENFGRTIYKYLLDKGYKRKVILPAMKDSKEDGYVIFDEILDEKGHVRPGSDYRYSNTESSSSESSEASSNSSSSSESRGSTPDPRNDEDPKSVRKSGNGLHPSSP